MASIMKSEGYRMRESQILADPIAAARATLASNNLNWAGIDWRPFLSYSPRERMQVWLDVVREFYRDDTKPKFAFSCEVDAGLHIISVTPGPDPQAKGTPAITKAVFGLTVPHIMASGLGTLHGGYAGVMFDRATTLLLAGASKQGFYDFSAVSTGMSIFWQHPIAIGEDVELEVEFETINQSICVVTGKFRKAISKTVCITGQHQMKSLKALSGSSEPRL